ncbi:5'-3' exoribonuclease 2, partial [Coemansia javaensis]
MGVAAFYRWLVRKYPRVQTHVIEEKPTSLNGIEIPVDATKPNPNGVELDNLYLDMNGIVHPCCHPQHKEAPETEQDMMLEVFKCLDRVFSMIRPRKLVYMALDGVAPRAKMNQQRSRRFRAAQEAEEKEREQAKAAEEIFQATGERQPEPPKPWDSNCITPGTPFMELLARSLRYYIALKLNTDPAWRTVKVILSDSNVPGEGEHKIMDYIRRQRRMPAYDPNTSHVLYGLDADLIMLSLATHEPHFRILREDVTWADTLSKPCGTCGQKGHFTRDCRGRGQLTPPVDPNDQPFVFANIAVLREYLSHELVPDKTLPFPFDLERAIDDWVFLCFFVGNDFLPHLPSLEIREGAIEKLIAFWKEELPTAGGYITHSGDVDLFRVQPIMDKIGQLEEQTFKDRKREEKERERRMRRNQRRDAGEDASRAIEAAADQMAATAAANARRLREEKERADARNFAAASALRARLVAARPSAAVEEEEEEDEVMVSGTAPAKRTAADLADGDTMAAEATPGDSAEPPAKQAKIEPSGLSEDAASSEEAAATDAAEESGNGEAEPDAKGNPASDTQAAAFDESGPMDAAAAAADNDESEATEAAAADESEATVPDSSEATVPDSSEPNDAAAGDDDEVVDEVKFHEAGYKQRYYGLKFKISADDKDAVFDIVKHYVRGLCWVLRYYYQGCASWGWYYPYHYAPLASDFADLDTIDTTFELGEPLRPYEQLMGVLPARSRHNLPPEFAPLMTSPDSPIIDFYPVDFPLDLNGKKFLWQAVILLPFIDKERLLDAVQRVYPSLSPEDAARNERGYELLVASAANPVYESLCDVYTAADPDKRVALNPRVSGRVSGSVSCDPAYVPHTKCESPLRSVGQRDIDEDRSITVVFHQPQPDTPHAGVLLPGVRMPRRILTPGDIEFARAGGNAGRGGRGGARNGRHENNRDFAHFYRQQGNDVSADRGHGPRRYDDQGNVNPEYQRYYSFIPDRTVAHPDHTVAHPGRMAVRAAGAPIEPAVPAAEAGSVAVLVAAAAGLQAATVADTAAAIAAAAATRR